MGNIFANIKLPEYPDFTGDRARYEALKHAEQQRKIQAAQSLMQMAEFGRKQQDWQRQDAFQAALGNLPPMDPETGLPPAETVHKLYGIDAARAGAWYKSALDTANAARDNRTKARTEREKDQQLALHDIDSGMQIEDPQKRLEYVMQNWERYRKLNVLTPDEHEELARDGLTVPLHDRMATRLLGQEKFNEYQQKALQLSEAQKEAASKAITRPATEEKTLLDARRAKRQEGAVAMFNTTNQEEWDATLKSLPEDMQPLMPKTWSNANRYRALAKGQTASELAAQEQRGVPKTAKELIVHMNQPDTTPEEKAIDVKSLEQMQAYDVAVAEATAGAKPMSAESSKVYAVAQSLIPEARLLQEAIRTGGRKALLQIMTKSDPKLARLADSVADKVGRLRSGGAVNAGEEARFMAQLARWADLLGNDSDMSAPTDAIERLIGEASTVAGGMRPGQKAPDSNAPVQPGTYPNPIVGAPPVNIPATPQQSRSAAPSGRKAIPNVGTVRKDNDGNERVFIGGDPNNKGNWPVRGK